MSSNNTFGPSDVTQITQPRVEQGKHAPADLKQPFGELAQFGPLGQLVESMAARESLNNKGRAREKVTPTPTIPQIAEYGFTPAKQDTISPMDIDMAALMAALMAQQQAEANVPRSNNVDIMNWAPAQSGQQNILSKPSQHINTLTQPLTGIDASGKPNEKTATSFGAHFDIMKAGVFSELKEAPLTEAKARQQEKYHEILRKIHEHKAQETRILNTEEKTTIITSDLQRTQELMQQENIANRVSPSVDARRKLKEAPTKKLLARLLKLWQDAAVTAFEEFNNRQKKVVELPGSPGKKKQNLYGAEHTGGSSHVKHSNAG